jgi:flagellar biosynthetic protein FlhB
MADQMSDRTEAPTSKRLSDARNRGQVVKSQDLSGVVDLLGALVVLVVFGGTIATTCAAILRRFLAPDATGFDLTPHSIAPAMKLAFGQAGLILLPVLAVAAVVAFVAQFMQVGWKVTPEPIRPKLDKLDPLKGLARVFGKKGLIKTGMNTLKLTVVLTVAYLMVVSQTDAIAALPAMTAVVACYAVLKILLTLTLVLLAIMLAIGVIDYAVQRWQHNQDLRMTKQEVKDERRSMEGDPQVKG